MNSSGVGISVKVQWAIQSILLVVSVAVAFSFYGLERRSMRRGEENKIMALADGVINGANMLMINGIISDVEQRKLFIKKMGSSPDIKSLRIIRNKLVQKQFGMGLPEEQPAAEDERQSLEDGKVRFERRGDMLHGIVPYTESHNFRGTDCLMCHQVPVGYHNGASVIDLDISSDNAKLKKFIGISVGVIAATQIVLWLLIKFVLTRFVTEPAGKMQQTIQEIAESGDFTRRVPIHAQDEIGRTCSAFNELMSTLQQAFRGVHEGIERLAESSHTLSASSHQVATGSAHQSEATSAMAATVQEITVSVNHISEGTQQALKLSQSSGALSEQGGNIIHSATEEMKRIADTVKKTASSIENLGEQSNRISSIIEVIKEIADQTNLLALNAAIEAARAGEMGRGFSVVADEVRKLAERTASATSEVTQMIHSMQQASQASVMEMATAVDQVGHGVELAEEAGKAINQIKGESAEVVKTVGEISSALIEQSMASNDIAHHIEEISQMTEQNSDAAQKTADSADHLQALADDMRSSVERFKI